MIIKKKTVEATIEICNILAEKECTIAELSGIFTYVENKLRNNAVIQKKDYSEVFKEELEECEKI